MQFKPIVGGGPALLRNLGLQEAPPQQAEDACSNLRHPRVEAVSEASLHYHLRAR